MTDDGPGWPAVSEALLNESAEDLYEHAPCGYLSTTPDGLIVKVNQTFLTWTGYRRDELLGRMRFNGLLRVGGRIFYETHFVLLLRMHGAANEIAFDLVRKDGQTFPALVSATERRDESGQAAVHRMTVFNASERRRYEQELLRAKRAAEQAASDLRRSEAAMATDRDRLRQILDVLPVAVLIAGPDGRCEVANAAARAMGQGGATTEPPTDAEGTAQALWLRHADGTLYAAEDLPLQRSLQTDEEARTTDAVIRYSADGPTIPVLASSAPLHDATGAMTGAVAVYQDISALKELERAREEFLGAAAHDLKTPLAAILGLAQLARRRLRRLTLPDVEPIMAHLEKIDVATRRMASLIDELVDSTRLQAGTLLDLQVQPTDMVALAQDVVTQQQGATDHRLILDTVLPALVVPVDARRIERVLSNLLGNAVKYSPDGGQITVSIRHEDDGDTHWAVVGVSDQGMGIPASDLPRIFERYYRAGNVRGRIAGTGIGLASVRQIAEHHGGTVSLTSQEGRGTTVLVRLPMPAGSGQSCP